MLILWLLQPLVRSLKEQLSVNDAIGCSQPGDSTPPAGGTGCNKGGSTPSTAEVTIALGCRNVYLSLFRIVAHVSVMRKLSSM